MKKTSKDNRVENFIRTLIKVHSFNICVQNVIFKTTEGLLKK